MADYRTIFGLDPRHVVWVVAQIHLLFGAFVLAVPIFAVVIEVAGALAPDRDRGARLDRLAREFTRLLTAAFSMTAALGGLLTFVLFAGYPSFMRHMTDVFHGSFAVYGLLFLAEGATLYLYHYSWERLRDRKTLHVSLGVALNLFGIAIMAIANSWTTYMMGPPGLAPQAAGPLDSHWDGGRYVGPASEAFANALWMPLNLHRFLANLAFGGAICGAYAAIRFLGAESDERRAHYDWMGYSGNLIAIGGLLPLPFAGYYLGREIYSFNPTMGQDMMGGTFSWSFILQAALVGGLFLAGNFYLWSGMARFPGGERFEPAIPWLALVLFGAFAVWLTPHNLPLGGLEKRFGLMPAKNAVIQAMILATFVGFLLYRRAGKGEPRPMREQGVARLAAVALVAALSAAALAAYARSGDLAEVADAAAGAGGGTEARFPVESLPVGPFVVPVHGAITFAGTLRALLYFHAAALGLAVGVAFLGRGKLAETFLLGETAFLASAALFQHGFTIMERANPLLRQVAVCQVLLVLSTLATVFAIDLVLYRGAKALGPVRWGRMHRRSQYALLLIAILFVLNMGLMGLIRSGLRKGWHVVAVIPDRSEWASTPTEFETALVVTGVSLAFGLLVGFLFWVTSLGEDRDGAAVRAAGGLA